jgi:hypothetical protein
MVELLQSHGGIVTPDIAAIYRQTDLARQMLTDDELGVLPPGIKPADKSLVEELLRFGADGGATEIVRMALDRVRGLAMIRAGSAYSRPRSPSGTTSHGCMQATRRSTEKDISPVFVSCSIPAA